MECTYEFMNGITIPHLTYGTYAQMPSAKDNVHAYIYTVMLIEMPHF